MACTWEGDAGVGEFVTLLLLNRRCCCRRRHRVTREVGVACCFVLLKWVSATVMTHSHQKCLLWCFCTVSGSAPTTEATEAGWDCVVVKVFFLCDKGRVASLSLFFLSPLWSFTDRQGIACWNEYALGCYSVNVTFRSKWTIVSLENLATMTWYCVFLFLCYFEHVKLVKQVYNIGYILLHFWNSRWVTWIRRCLQVIAKKVLGCKRPKH